MYRNKHKILRGGNNKILFKDKRRLKKKHVNKMHEKAKEGNLLSTETTALNLKKSETASNFMQNRNHFFGKITFFDHV